MTTLRRSIHVLLFAVLAASAAQSQESRPIERDADAVIAELKGIRAALERQARRYEADLALRRLELALQRLAPAREERRRLREQLLAAEAEYQSVLDELQFLQRRQRESDVLEQDKTRQARLDQLQVTHLRQRRRADQVQQQLVEVEAEYTQLKGAVDELERVADRALIPPARP